MPPHLHNDRVVLLGKGVDYKIANVLVTQLLYLANEDSDKREFAWSIFG